MKTYEVEERTIEEIEENIRNIKPARESMSARICQIRKMKGLDLLEKETLQSVIRDDFVRAASFYQSAIANRIESVLGLSGSRLKIYVEVPDKENEK